MRKLKLSKHNFIVLIVFLLFAIVFCSISLVNHAQFRTFALDLGVYNHALYSFANFRPAIFTLGIDGNEIPFLGTHFSPIMFLYVPFYFLFGTYSLLIVQILAILFGGLAIYKYSVGKFPLSNVIPMLVLIQFFSIWGIYAALSFDFHNNVIASMLVLWFIYFNEKKKFIISSLFWLLVLLAQENMAIWMIFILTGLIILNRKNGRELFKYNSTLLVLTILYTVIILLFVMPSIQGTDNNLQLGRYSHLGPSFKGIALALIQKPLYTFSLLFKNSIGNPEYDGIKTNLHLVVLASGGIFLFLRPAYLVMLIPIYAQKLLSNDFGFWGINMQYSIEFVPIISLALIDTIGSLKKHSTQITLLVTLLTIGFSIRSINYSKIKWYDNTNEIFYSKKHYNPKINISDVKYGLQLIDQESSVSASSVLVPRLAFREKIYHFPVVKDAGYIALIKQNRGTYPLSKEEFEKTITNYKESNGFSVIYETADIVIFKKCQ